MRATRGDVVRRILILITCTAMLLVGVGPALAEHNDIGVRYGVGNPDPGIAEDASGDVSDDLRLIYHAGGNLPAPAGVGNLPRISPADQSGQGLGDWIGFIDGVIEHPGPGWNRCFIINPSFACEPQPDPLYRLNPAAEDEGCEDLADNTELGEDPANPDDDPCSGADHRSFIEFWPPVRIQNHKIDVISDPDEDGSGFTFPGNYGYYVYLFGQGTGPAAGTGDFEMLPDDLCEAPTGHFAPGSNKDCKLITPVDLDVDLEPGQHAAVCMYRAFFTTISGGSNNNACPNISEFNAWREPSDSSFYLANKPGWYMVTRSNNDFASLDAYDNVVTFGGNRTDIARGGAYHYYVNPVRPASHLWCVGPPVATTASDGLDSGLTLLRNEDDSWAGWELDRSIEYRLEAHDVDVYLAFEETDTLFDEADRLQEDIEDSVPPIVGDLLGLVGDTIDALQDETAPVTDAVGSLTSRLGPNVPNGAEPNRPGDNSFTLNEDSPSSECSPVNGLTDASDPTTYTNYIQAVVDSVVADSIPGSVSGNNIAGFGGDALHDYTYLGSDGLPADTSEQGFNPWHPDQWAIFGSILTIDDLDEDQRFDDCPPGDDPPSSSEDICAARMPFDLYNPDALRDEGNMGDKMRLERFGDPTGMYFVLRVTGPTVILNENEVLEGVPAAVQDFETVPDFQLLEGEGQHCVVGTSIGLLDLGAFGQGERFRQLHDVDANANPSELLAKICDGSDGTHLLIEDAFADAPQAGSFTSQVQWIPLEPKPEALENDDDGVDVHYVVTVGPGSDLRTETNLKLGTHGPDDPTVAKVWTEDGSNDVTYKWTDQELFDSEPGQPSD